MNHRRLIILGSGPAGCTAAIYAARANLKPMMIMGKHRGGLLTETTEVDNWPGESAGLKGRELMKRMMAHAERLQVELIKDEINTVDLKTRPFHLFSKTQEYVCDALIIATGSNPILPPIPSVKSYLGRGVSICATCDGFFYKDQPIAIIGGGNVAITEAIFLANLCSHIYVVEIQDHVTAEKTLLNQFMKLVDSGKITLKLQHELTNVVGNDVRATGIEIKSCKTGQMEKIDILGAFIAIGYRPNSQLFENQLDLTQSRCIKIKGGIEENASSTNIPGVFAAGDIVTSAYRQAVAAAGFGCIAALDAEKYLMSLSL